MAVEERALARAAPPTPKTQDLRRPERTVKASLLGGAPREAADTGQDGAQDRQFVTALARGLQILGCFSAARPSIGVTEIAGMLGLPQPTVWRLCHTMTKLGYLALDDEERLRPALAVLRLGYTVLSELTAAKLARPHLQELADRFGGAAGVAVRDGADMRFVERCESDSQLLMNLRVGSRVSLATSALGWAYLAGLPEAEREEVVGATEADRKAWRAVEGPFRRALEEYEGHGFIVNPGVFHPGYNTAAVPVVGADGRSLFALNCGGATSIVSLAQLRTEIGPRLRALATMLESVV
jgi:DNA-binding IclR family transcriptional regulator